MIKPTSQEIMLESMNVNAKLLNPNLSDSEVNQNVHLSLDAILNFAKTKDQTSMSERIAFFNRYYWDQYSEEEYVLKYETITSLINEIINNLETDPKSLIGRDLAEQWSKIFPTTMTEKEMAEFKDSMALCSKLLEEYNKWQANSLSKNSWLAEMGAMIAYKKALLENTVDEFLAQNNRPNISDEVTKWLMIMNTNAMKEINLSK